MKATVTFLVLVFCLIAKNSNGQNIPIKIKLSNIQNAKATIYVAFFKPENDFPTFGKQAFYFKSAPNGKDTLTVDLSAIPAGDYAITVYQDLNQNEKLDKNFFGIPKEPYAFSQNFHPKLSKPSFGDCKITIAHAGQAVSIAMIN